MKIEGHGDTLLHRKTILATQFRAGDIRIELPQGATEDLFPRSANRPYRGSIDVNVTKVSIEENVDISDSVENRLKARMGLPQ
jgi:hypothetical protein